jgi:hypothetical protein
MACRTTPGVPASFERESTMGNSRGWYLGIVAVAAAVLVSASFGSLKAMQAMDPKIRLGPSDLGGVVTGAHGPEAGVWVIAETDDLPTKYAKIVVTDDDGRYVVPGLPKATYHVWVRGYGLIDSPKVTTVPGKMLDLSAVPAPDAAAAAKYYPALYWFSMLKIPDASEFPGTGPTGNGIMPGIKSQDEWIDLVKTDGCVTCHQLGNLATRTINPHLGTFANSQAAWARRIESGQASGVMLRTAGTAGPRLLKNFGDWTDRIARGELPFAKPERPQGIERNVVITEWDWATPTTYLHDEISTDKRNPTVNAWGKLYGSTEESTDFIPSLDPVHNLASFVKVPVSDPATPSFGGTSLEKPTAPSVFWGDKRIWYSQTTVHNPMIDAQGDLWLTARNRPAADPAFCKAGGDNPSAGYPLQTSSRQSAMYDPKSRTWKLVNLCFNTHHLTFGYDPDNTLWYSAGGGSSNVLGWLDTKVFAETGDSDKAQGWTPLILDTTGTGKRTAAFTQPDQPADPAKDRRINGDFYGIGVDRTNGAVWGSVLGVPGKIVRVNPGPNPPVTALSEVYDLPENAPSAPVHGYSPRGMDITTTGVVWAPLASGELASFDRNKCRGPLNGPAATGAQCPEGWTLYPFPGPQFKGLAQAGSAEAAYYVWVDQHNTFGLGANIPYATGNENDAIEALVNGKWVTLRIPYPIGFYEKNLDGRIDDAKLGWKGRGLWTAYGSRAPFHMETGKGTRPKVLHIQMRPDPLAD